MIWNSAQNVIFNGSAVQAVMFNGNVIWPGQSPYLPVTWSASGYSVSPSLVVAAASVPMYLTWVTASDPQFISALSATYTVTGAYAKQNDSPFTWDSYTYSESVTTMNSSTKHKNLYMKVSARAQAGQSQSSVISGFIFYFAPVTFRNTSAAGYSGMHDGYSASFDRSTGWKSSGSFNKSVTGGEVVTAKSGQFGYGFYSATNSVSSLSLINSGNYYYSSKNTAAVSCRWTASGIYDPAEDL